MIHPDVLAKARQSWLDFFAKEDFRVNEFYEQAMEHFPAELDTEEFWKDACSVNGRALECTSPNCRTLDVCSAAYKQNRDSVKYMPDGMADKVRSSISAIDLYSKPKRRLPDVPMEQTDMESVLDF